MKRLFTSFVLAISLCVGVYAQLPAVSLKTIDGKTIKTDTLHNDGKPLIIDFFATWCKPCNRELSAITEVYKDWQKETGVKLIAISIDQAQNVHKVAPLVSENEWPFETPAGPQWCSETCFGHTDDSLHPHRGRQGENCV